MNRGGVLSAPLALSTQEDSTPRCGKEPAALRDFNPAYVG